MGMEPREETRAAVHEAHESSHLGRSHLHVRFLFLALGMLLIGEAMLQPIFLKSAGHESVERRFLRSSHAMMRKRVPPRKGPLEMLPEGSHAASGDQQPRRAAAAVVAADTAWGGGLSSAANGTACRRLLWFMCLGPSPTLQQRQQLHAALLSARRHAPSLVPVLVHSGAPGELARWFGENGGHAVQHELSFLGALKQQRNAKLREGLLRHQGGFMRLDIPLVVERIVEEGLLDLSNVTTEYALYTDSDVLFLGGSSGSAGGGGGGSGGRRWRKQAQQGTSAGGGLSTCSIPAPRLLMVGREKARGVPWDTGVMLINVPALRRALPSLVKFGREAGFDFQGWEQGMINAFLRAHTPALEVLPDALSWKAYWGSHPGAVLLHWLGPKPAHARCMRCFMANKHRGSAWSHACACTRVPFKSIFQLSPDQGRMYGEALDAFEAYQQQADAAGSAAGSGSGDSSGGSRGARRGGSGSSSGGKSREEVPLSSQKAMKAAADIDSYASLGRPSPPQWAGDGA